MDECNIINPCLVYFKGFFNEMSFSKVITMNID